MPLPNILTTPSLIQKLQWIVDPVRYLENAAEKYPDIFTANIVGYGCPVVFVNHPQAIQEIFTNDRNKFAALGEANKIFQPLIGNTSTIMLDGDRHKKRRQLLIPPFHGERMRAYGSLICDLTKQVFSKLPINQSFSARTIVQEISLLIILEAVFGLHKGERYDQLRHLLGLLMDVFQSPLTSSFLLLPFLQKDLGHWSPWGKFLHQRQQIDQLLYAEIAERREKPDLNRIDILSLLMSARDEAGNSMTDQELRDELMTLLLAGHETSATGMAWALYWIHYQPEIRETLLQELDNLGNNPDPMSIFRLPYLTNVVNETLRMYPLLINTLPRVAQEPVELLGHSIEAGTVVVGGIYLTHHRESLYAEPDKFRPERFLESQFSPYEYMPFGAGARRCVGEALALFEMKLVVATILSKYQLDLESKQPEKAQRRSVTLGPANGVRMLIKGQRIRQTSLVSVVNTSAL
ncbi:cytochrome P450 [Nostoc spongiaeforme FACHB-130]|uniref:Cytochrome P450 n=1 Tax=Nostoc spongiaeforme FACHB-130 TaxID=1357510 RepID=A0ABR8FR03_9NOSO|nr:cytochrome P450 [Nostoc spongiaeforme]MBD2593865.1 cytochrome P450 [Nostoc spongiaeforme FACHB-130]